MFLVKNKSGKRDSNSRPQPWQGCALPTELLPLMFFRLSLSIDGRKDRAVFQTSKRSAIIFSREF